jgi:hypothetical protein
LDDADGRRRTLYSLYSLRHTYATTILFPGQLTELELARNMGTGIAQIDTGIAQIEKHYSR